MDVVGKAIDRTLGALIRWIGGQWERGRDEKERQRVVLREIGVAIGEVVAESNRIGRGYAADAKYRDTMLRAELRAGSLATEVESAEVRQAVETFRRDAMYVFDYTPGIATWEDTVAALRAAHGHALKAIQVAQNEM